MKLGLVSVEPPGPLWSQPGMESFRLVLPEEHVHPSIREKVQMAHRDVVQEVEAAIRAHAVVVVGMAQNPHVKKARRLLTEAGIPFEYLEYGSYLSQWRRRLRLKMWSGWATFPMVFVQGSLVGGASDLAKQLEVDALNELRAHA